PGPRPRTLGETSVNIWETEIWRLNDVVGRAAVPRSSAPPGGWRPGDPRPRAERGGVICPAWYIRAARGDWTGFAAGGRSPRREPRGVADRAGEAWTMPRRAAAVRWQRRAAAARPGGRPAATAPPRRAQACAGFPSSGGTRGI